MATGSKVRVVIVGGGFGGLATANGLKSTRIDVTLIDRTNHHLFQPLLYQVATAALSASDVAQPLRAILRGRENIRVVMDDVVAIRTSNNTVIGTIGTYEYDYLILAPGSRHSYFGHSSWEHHAPGLKTLGDALHIRSRLLATFEQADRSVGTPELRELLTFVIVGGGPTGVEMAGAIAEISLRTMLPDFPRIRRSDVRIVLVEAGGCLLPGFDPSLSSIAKRSLESIGVEVVLNTAVTDVAASAVQLTTAPSGTASAEGGRHQLATRTIIWAAGNEASPLLADLHAPFDRNGRILIQPDCRVPGLANVFVIGDCANLDDGTGKPLPGVAQTAIQMGAYVAKGLVRMAEGKAAFHHPFRYKDLGSMATIGRASAVADVFGIRFGGFLAWLAWAGLHILKLISFRNRLKVLVEWMWYYVSFQPGARILYDDSVHAHPKKTPSSHA